MTDMCVLLHYLLVCSDTAATVDVYKTDSYQTVCCH